MLTEAVAPYLRVSLSMDIQPMERSVKRWPVRAAPPKVETAGVDPVPTSVGPIRGARPPFGVLWLFVPAVLLFLGSAYWLSILWAHALIQREGETTAAIVEGQRVIWGVAAGGALLLTLALILAVITTFRRYAGHVKSLRTQLSQRAKTVESTNRQLQEALETNDRRDNELNRLLEVAEAVGGAVTEEELYGTVAQAAARACSVDRCSILLRDSAGESLVPVTRRFAEEGGSGRTEGFPDKPAKSRPRHAAPDDRRRGAPPATRGAHGRGRRAGRLVKLAEAVPGPIRAGRSPGASGQDGGRPQPGASPRGTRLLSASDSLATTLATQAAAALDKARLYQEIAQRLRQTETLLAVMKILASTPTSPRRCDRPLARSPGPSGPTWAGVWCVTGGSEQLGFVAGYHVPPDLRSSVAEASVSMQDDVIKRLKRTEGPIYATNSQADHRFNHPLTRLISHKSIVLQPIQGAEELVGFLALAWVGERHAFQSEEIGLLAGTGRQLAVAVAAAPHAGASQPAGASERARPDGERHRP